jgi:hypothetical protein
MGDSNHVIADRRLLFDPFRTQPDNNEGSSVHRLYRRRGIARRVLAELLHLAPENGVTRIVVETNARWTEAQSLYEASGFTFTHSAPGAFGPENSTSFCSERGEDGASLETVLAGDRAPSLCVCEFGLINQPKSGEYKGPARIWSHVVRPTSHTGQVGSLPEPSCSVATTRADMVDPQKTNGTSIFVVRL